MTQFQNLIWVEKYRPQTLKDVMLPERIKVKFEDGCYSNFLFVGLPGTGKTTLARILAKGHDILMINASTENGIETIRNKIMNFCQAASYKGHRYVILDEADMLTSQAQTALRGTIEMFNKVARFIFTCNYPEKILEPIQSRLETINFNFTQEEEEEQYINHLRRIVYICKNEGVKISRDAAEALLRKSFPDLRTVINTLQSIAKNTKDIKLDDIEKVGATSADAELYEFLVKTSYPPEIYAYIKSKYMNKEHECYRKLSSEFIDWLIANDHGEKIGQASVIVHKYQTTASSSIDKLIPLLACCTELTRIFK